MRTPDEPLSGLVPGVSVFCGEDPHRVLSGGGSSPQNTVELFHYVTARGHGQTTPWSVIEYIQLEELEREREREREREFVMYEQKQRNIISFHKI